MFDSLFHMHKVKRFHFAKNDIEVELGPVNRLTDLLVDGKRAESWTWMPQNTANAVNGTVKNEYHV